MNLNIFIILSTLLGIAYLYDCISRFPLTFGEINSGVKAIGVIAKTETVHLLFYEHNGSLLIVRTVVAGYTFIAIKISPWTST